MSSLWSTQRPVRGATVHDVQGPLHHIYHHCVHVRLHVDLLQLQDKLKHSSFPHCGHVHTTDWVLL